MFINNLNPVAWNGYGLDIRWYGIFLGIATLTISLTILKLFKKENLSEDLALSLIVWLFVGGLIGARLGHIIFYEPSFYLTNLKEIIFINHGGLSSHGLTLGLLISFLLFVKLKKPDWKKILDLIVVPLPIIIVLVRLGNFFNSEIVGKPSNLPWAVLFPNYETNLIPRHPTQIYEAILGLIILFIMIYLYKKDFNKKPLFLFHTFLFLYFSSRFLVEFTKDYETLGFSYFLTMGQILSLPFIIWSIYWFIKNRQ